MKVINENTTHVVCRVFADGEYLDIVGEYTDLEQAREDKDSFANAYPDTIFIIRRIEKVN